MWRAGTGSDVGPADPAPLPACAWGHAGSDKSPMFRPPGRGFPLDRVTPLVFTLKPRMSWDSCCRPEATRFF